MGSDRRIRQDRFSGRFLGRARGRWAASLALALLVVIAPSAAGAAEPEPDSAVAIARDRCLETGDPFVMGQVWQDAPPPDGLLTSEDAGVGGVTVSLGLPGLQAFVTAEDGFFGFCVTDPEAVRIETKLTVVAPDGTEFVSSGAGPEDRDSDVEPGTGESAGFVIVAELGGDSSQFSVEGSILRLDVGLVAGGGSVNPCPAFSAELVEADPDGDWDGDLIVNREDDEPCTVAGSTTTTTTTVPATTSTSIVETTSAPPPTTEPDDKESDGSGPLPVVPIAIAAVVVGTGATLITRAVKGRRTDDDDDDDPPARARIVGGED
jgi:hypothetical protein